MITTEQIKKLREITEVSVMACKKALEQVGGDIEKAILILQKKGAEIARKKESREVGAGVIESYIHNNNQLGVLVEVRSETDFVARNKEFRTFAHNIAMHIAASNPEDVKELLEQAYIKESEITVNDYLKQMIQKFGENIKISRFFRCSLK
ncbi:MAG: translation elongation factor Ts [Candidatus Parcubacteria bacterium]|nr:translation elongation factor Ts [Candidatus Parcubacteria bacterium]